MPAEPVLAVVVANYNYEQFVGRAVCSILDQKRADVEIVVVDDGSTDGSWDAISALAETYEFKAVRRVNGGQLAACCTGLALTQAPFILFLDSDDELAPGALDVVIPLLSLNVAKLQFALSQIDNEGCRIGLANPALTDYRDSIQLCSEVLATGVYVSPPTSGNVFRRDVLDLLAEIDYEPTVDGVILFAAPFMGEVVSLSAELGRYRIHSSNLSGAGKPPTLEAISTELRRFEARHAHLARHLTRLGAPAPVNAPCTFFHRERSLYLSVVAGSRPRLSSLPGLVRGLVAQPMPLGRKVALGAVIALIVVLPKGRARAVLDERFKLRGRGVRSLARAAILGRVA